MRSGPSEQLRPTESGFTCFTAFQNASMVCAEIIVSPPRPTAAEIMTGSSWPSSSKTSRMATSAALALSESKMVSTSSRSRAAGDERAHLADVGRLDLVEGDDAEAGVVGVGRVRERDRQRPDGARDEARAAVGVGDAVGPFAALARRLLVDLPGEVVEELVLDDLLVETPGPLRPPCSRGSSTKNSLWAMLVAPKVLVSMMSAPASRKRRWMSPIIFGLGEREDVAVVQQILLRVLEALAANVRLGHPVGADGRAHRAVDDGDAFLARGRRRSERTTSSPARVSSPRTARGEKPGWRSP